VSLSIQAYVVPYGLTSHRETNLTHITTHYSANETYRLINNAERAVNWYEVKPALTVYAGKQTRSQYGPIHNVGK